MRQLETYDLAPSAPGLLQKAGVKFALYSDGVDTPRDFQLCEEGDGRRTHSREQKLRALTLTPAEIYGVSDRLGSIEKGKIANLVVTRGDIFENATKVEMMLSTARNTRLPPTQADAAARLPPADNPGGNR